MLHYMITPEPSVHVQGLWAMIDTNSSVLSDAEIQQFIEDLDRA
jgi:hypothetical protein